MGNHPTIVRPDASTTPRTTPRFAFTERLEPRRLLALAVDAVGFEPDDPVHEFEVELSADFDSATLGVADVTVENLTLRDALPGGWTVNYDPLHPDSFSVDLIDGHFDSPSYLPDGNYAITVWSGGVADLLGDPLVITHRESRVNDVDLDSDGTITPDERGLYFLNGDFNRDRTVDLADFTIYRNNFGLTGRTFATGDADGDGTVSLSDYTAMRNNYSRNLEAPPSRPGEVVAHYAGTDSILLEWDLPATGTFDGFRIYRSLGGKDQYELVTEVREDPADPWVDDASYKDAGLFDGTEYWYDVRAFTDAGGNSPWTDDATATTQLHELQNVSADFLDDGRVYVSWELVGYGQTHAVVEYTTGDPLDPATVWQEAATVDGWQSYWVADGLPGTLAEQADYGYRVRGELRDDAGSVLITTVPSDGVTPELATPTLVSAQMVEVGELEVTWKNDDAAVTQHRVEISADGGVTWDVLADDVGVGQYQSGTATFSELDDNASYEIRVRSELVVVDMQSLIAVKESAWSNLATAHVPVKAPDVVNAEAVDGLMVQVTWTDSSSGEAGYVVERRLSADSSENWSLVGEFPPNSTVAHDQPPLPNERYVYRVIATSGAGAGVTSGQLANSDSATEDVNDVSPADVVGENIVQANDYSPLVWAYEGNQISAKMVELNDLHSHVSFYGGILSNGDLLPYFLTFLSVYTNDADSVAAYDSAVAAAEGMVGLSSTDSVRLNGQIVWSLVRTVTGVSITNNDSSYTIVSESVVEVDSPFPTILHNNGLISHTVPHTGDSALVETEVAGSLVDYADSGGDFGNSNSGNAAPLFAGGISAFEPFVGVDREDATADNNLTFQLLGQPSPDGSFDSVKSWSVTIGDEGLRLKGRLSGPDGPISGRRIYVEDQYAVDEQREGRVKVRFVGVTDENGEVDVWVTPKRSGTVEIEVVSEVGGRDVFQIDVAPDVYYAEWPAQVVSPRVERLFDDLIGKVKENHGVAFLKQLVGEVVDQVPFAAWLKIAGEELVNTLAMSVELFIRAQFYKANDDIDRTAVLRDFIANHGNGDFRFIDDASPTLRMGVNEVGVGVIIRVTGSVGDAFLSPNKKTMTVVYQYDFTATVEFSAGIFAVPVVVNANQFRPYKK